jgi:hypothetical protein
LPALVRVPDDVERILAIHRPAAERKLVLGLIVGKLADPAER